MVGSHISELGLAAALSLSDPLSGSACTHTHTLMHTLMHTHAHMNSLRHVHMYTHGRNTHVKLYLLCCYVDSLTACSSGRTLSDWVLQVVRGGHGWCGTCVCAME